MIDWNETTVGKDDEITLVSLSGELDTESADYLYDVLTERVDSGCDKLILDCHRLDFITSMGLATLLRIHTRLRKKGGDVKLARVHGPVADVFRIVRLDKLFHLHETVQDAAQSFGDEDAN